MRLLIVRHAESEGNASGNYSTAIADSLSVRGLEQAEELADRLSNVSVDSIAVSPRLRAKQTILPYLRKVGTVGEIWPEIAEACWHENREASSESWRSEPDELDDSMASHFSYRDGTRVQPAGRESFGEGLLRVHETVGLLKAMTASQSTLLMVTHGHFLRELLNLLLALPHLARFPHDNCGVTSLTYSGDLLVDFVNSRTRVV